jgi:triosephosphate isomerase
VTVSVPLLGISLKMYFQPGPARAWMQSVARTVRSGGWPENCDMFVLPDYLCLADAGRYLAPAGIAFGAQDVCWADSGPYTGEVSAPALAAIGCRYVAVGHAERRRLLGENDQMTAGKAAAATRHGLVPVVCIGEPEAGPPWQAARHCAAQLAPVLEAVPEAAEIVVAYEPVWAIGADRPAAPSYVREVCGSIRDLLVSRTGRARILYGGSAGPGLFGQLAPMADGLFLGRFAHDPANVAAVLSEITRCADRL